MLVPVKCAYPDLDCICEWFLCNARWYVPILACCSRIIYNVYKTCVCISHDCILKSVFISKIYQLFLHVNVHTLFSKGEKMQSTLLVSPSPSPCLCLCLFCHKVIRSAEYIMCAMIIFRIFIFYIVYYFTLFKAQH